MKPPEYYANMEANIPKGQLRTRFAPSPTGYMHVGNLRTALYGYLLARKAGGVFMLRIEDTDLERAVEGATEIIYSTLASCGITHDEGPDVGGSVGPYIQSHRREIYAAYADLIISKGHAYRCFCDKDTLEEMRNIQKASRIPHKYDGRCSRLTLEQIEAKLTAGTPNVVRQKIPPSGTTTFHDMVFGIIEVENSTLDDSVLIKGDGLPTYNFANVVDDHLMGITHVVRGSEYLSSTPKYNLLYQGFGWEIPNYIHCSPVMRDANNKLSKRLGDASFDDLEKKGYLKETILNYIALLGWSPGGEEEKFSLSELIEAFDVSGISRSPAIFDYKKLNWLNGAYLRALSDEAFHTAALPYIKQAVKRDIDTNYIAQVLKERCELLSAIPEQLDFIDSISECSIDLYNNSKMKTSPATAIAVLEEAWNVLAQLNNWTKETVHQELMVLAQRLGLKNGQLLWPLRVALSGKTFTPGGGIEICIMLGKAETVARIKQAVKTLNERLGDQA
ncbi:MAG: glutamate--tRNA ligase [Defluviitaleaceae bacterium]|nr:glutamate--tRNA ligase [Defluviitaleaceae bacterium]